MPDLHLEAVQRWMQAYMRMDADPPAEEIAQYIRPSARRSAAERLFVYREQTWLRTDNALEQDYGATRHFMGAPAFKTLARDYMKANPSRFVDVNRLRDGLPEFVESMPNPAFPDRGFVLDMLRLERAGWDVFHGPSDPAATAADLAGRDLMAEPLVPVRALRLMAFNYRVDTYVRQPVANPNQPWNAIHPNWLLIVRQGFEVRRLPLTLEQFQILSTLLEGGTAVAWISQTSRPVTAALVTAWLQLWLALGVFQKNGDPSH